MDQDLKHRLIGIVVVTSLAAIFVPMLFEDPIDETGKMISELKIPGAPLTSFDKVSALLPRSIEDVNKIPEPQAIKEQISRQGAYSDNNVWFIQVGIFGQESNAITLQNKIRKQGFPATVSKVDTANGKMYRVRVGPELDKKRVESMKLKVDKLNNLKSILTSVDE